jgi:hypothetical protein
MSKHRTSELTGPLLDAAVAMIEGYTLDADGDNLTVREPGGAPSKWAPSTDPAQGDRIIDRERIWTGWCDENSAWPGMWFAQFGEDYPNHQQIGPTRLIAAMRAFVESRLGASVDLNA